MILNKCFFFQSFRANPLCEVVEKNMKEVESEDWETFHPMFGDLKALDTIGNSSK